MTGVGQITHSLEWVTPNQAKKMLETNIVNRPISQAKVEQYARDMSNDNWNFSGPLMFNTQGHLIDGQHRLTAQVKAGLKLKWLIVRNVPDEAQRTMDTGKTRSAGDQLHMAGGHTNAALLAAIARNVYRIENDMMAGGTVISMEEVLQTVENHPELTHSTEIACQLRAGSMTPIAPNVIGAGHWMIAQVNGEAEADAFMYRIKYLSGERDGSPVLALARRCNEIKRMQQRVQHRDYLAMLIKAWNYDVENRSINKIATYSKTGTYDLPAVKKREVPLADKLDILDEDDGDIEQVVAEHHKDQDAKKAS